MKRLSAVTLALAGILSICSCSRKPVQDTSPISILVTNVTEENAKALAGRLKSEFDIDVEFVYQISQDRSNQIAMDLANCNNQADIVFTSARVSDDFLKESCVDLLSHSNLISYFPYTRIKEFSSPDGAVYQIPITTKLIGISYNETLMKEHGWRPPTNFSEMLELKRQCDRAGVKFSVSNFTLSGCGFNFLFHIMGAEWLSTIEGTEWLNGFLAGTNDAELFKEKSSYFRKWVDNGLFGSFYERSSVTAKAISATRALFAFDLTNERYSKYDGPQFDDDGRPTGRMLHDVYKMMPWISEDGTNNCFSVYDYLWATLDKRLLAPGKEEKFRKALKIVELLLNPDSSYSLASESGDIYLTVNNFEIAENRLYSDYAEEIRAGFLQPWYYPLFSSNTIVDTGMKVGSYVICSSLPRADAEQVSDAFMYSLDITADFDSVFETLEDSRKEGGEDILCLVEETLDYEQVAKILAISGAMALQKELDEMGKDETVQVALMPYIRTRKDLQPWTAAPVSNSVLYPGALPFSRSNVIIPPQGNYVSAVRLKGEEIKALVRDGFKPFAPQYPVCPYTLVTKGGAKLEDNAEYLVAVMPKAFNDGVYESLQDAARVVETANVIQGIPDFFAAHPTLCRENITW